MNLTQNQIEALKGECPKCFGTKKTPARRMDCRECKGTGQSSIEIKKEWVECELCLREIPKYKVGYIYEIHSLCGNIVEYFSQLGTKCLKCNNWIDRNKERLIKIKIISETETKQYVQMV